MNTVLIIGASSGIGKALAIHYAKANNKVIGIARRNELLNELATIFPNNFIPICLDISNVGKTRETLKNIVVEYPNLELIIHCAAIVKDNKNLDFEIEKDTLSINVWGFTNISDWAYNHLKLKNKGRYAVITSVFGSRGRRLAPAYNASKAFQINYLEGLKQKATFEKLKISILDIRAGFVDTAMAPDKTMGLPIISVDKAAYKISKAVCSNASVCYIPYYWYILDWILKLIPKRIFYRL